MRNRFINIIVLVLCMNLCSCEQSYTDKLKVQLETVLSERLEGYEFAVLIPNSGCPGCISEAEEYFKENASNEKILFIFTKFPTTKDLRLKMKISTLDLPNVYLDKEDLFYLSEFEHCKYPLVIYLRDGSVDRFANMDVLIEQIDQ